MEMRSLAGIAYEVVEMLEGLGRISWITVVPVLVTNVRMHDFISQGCWCGGDDPVAFRKTLKLFSKTSQEGCFLMWKPALRSPRSGWRG